MSKHTPGPWKYRGTLRTYIVEPVSSSLHVQRVAVVSKDIFAESQFNARLIAAALAKAKGAQPDAAAPTD